MLFFDELPSQDGYDTITESNITYYFYNGSFHKTDGPAVDGEDYKEYWNNGVLQKIIWPDGKIKLYVDGKCDGNIYMYNHLNELCIIGTEADERYKI